MSSLKSFPIEDSKKKIRDELDKLKAKGLTEPIRSHLHDVDCTWRYGSKPDYTIADYEFITGKTQNHSEGSLEKIVEDLVKTWEMESSHKSEVNEWKTIEQEDGVYHLSANNWKSYDKKEAIIAGNYNVLMHGCPKSIWDTESYSFEDSHHLIRNSFKAFPWEVLKVLSPPPTVTFTWRHWGKFTGNYKGNEGKGELLEMFGFAIARVSPDLKIEDIKIFYDPDSFIQALEGKTDAKELSCAKKLIGDVSCPFISKS
ncbi:hypothetical protein LOD99_10005 [Oopsacas minuta]|uniref:Pathogen-related protein n=1 Tax=Oopsacas minuta TaxID=111878 RepID=A0AAV7KJA4_9METZ|nr:hypothetical protein LOD99_10005 [Oopsacas minuta]